MTMLKLDLARLRELHEAATQDEFRVFYVGGGRDAFVIRSSEWRATDPAPLEMGIEFASRDTRSRVVDDAHVMAASRNALPALLDIAETATRMRREFSLTDQAVDRCRLCDGILRRVRTTSESVRTPGHWEHCALRRAGLVGEKGSKQ